MGCHAKNSVIPRSTGVNTRCDCDYVASSYHQGVSVVLDAVHVTKVLEHGSVIGVILQEMEKSSVRHFRRRDRYPRSTR